MKSFKTITVGAVISASALLLLASCGKNSASISGSIDGASEGEIVVKQLNINRYDILDTIKTSSTGQFSYKVGFKKHLPEFIYLFRGDTQLAALLLSPGEKAVVNADTLGRYSVSGSPESGRLQDVDMAYAEFNAKMADLSSSLDALKENSTEAKAVQQEMTKEYVSYYRDRMKYVMTNSFSLTVVPVLYQTVGDGGMPLFSQETDAILFNNICDSLETVYPGSPYVKALRQEASRRFSNLEVTRMLQSADKLGYVDLNLPDVKGIRRRLSETDAKAVLIYFWTPSVALQKMFNIEVLQPVYETYKDKGVEFYQIAIDTDKATWARIVRDQGLDWINVCDGLGDVSPALQSYNVTQTPASFLLVNDELHEAKFSSAAELRRLLDKNLK